MKKLLLVILCLTIVVVVASWLYIDLVLNEKDAVKDMRVCGLLSESNDLNEQLFLEITEYIEEGFQGTDTAQENELSSLEKNLPVEGMLLNGVSRGISASPLGRIQETMMVELWVDFQTGIKSDINILINYYEEDELTEVVLNGASRQSENGYTAIVYWDSESGTTEINHKYASGIFRPIILKRVGALGGILVLFFFMLLDKKREEA